MKRFKFTKTARILLVILALAIIGVLGWKTGAAKKVVTFAKNDVSSVFSKNDSTDEMYAKAEAIKKEDGAINISLDEWVGWKPIIDANGGLQTAKGSILDKKGIKLNISVINDYTQSSNALIKGDLNAAGYTVNRYAFLYDKFKSANVETNMGIIIDNSNGGNGIIAKKGINSLRDLIGKKIGIPRFSECQAMVEFLIQKSDLTADEATKLRAGFVPFDSPDDTAKAFYAGELDAASTWQPYLTQATSTVDAHILFSTKDAPNLIMDGLVFRKDFADKNKETIEKLLEGILEAQAIYSTDAKAISQSFPMFATQTDKETLDMTGDSQPTNSASMLNYMDKNGAAVNLFRDMANIWSGLGEKSDPANAAVAFDNTYIKDVAPKYTDAKVAKPTFTAEQKQTAQSQDNKQALLSQKLSISFDVGSASISSDSYASLKEFFNTANILNGTVIQIEGNTDNTGDATANQALSEKRAQSIAKYLQAQGLDASRFVVIGNGPNKPVADNNSAEGQAANRRTDMYFKVVK
jgi:NitT/TauT family transport system substrate-binding protein